MKRSWIKVVLGLLISAGALYLAFRGTDFRELFGVLKGTNYWYVLLAVGAYFFSMEIRSLRWKILLTPVKSIPSKNLYPSVVIGYAANNLLPFRAGEFVRAYTCGVQNGVSRSASFATIMLERVFDGLTMALFILIATWSVNLERGEQGQYISGIVTVVWLLFGGAFLGSFLLIFFKDKTLPLLEKMVEPLPGGIGGKVNSLLEKFLSGLEIMRSKSLLAGTFGLSICVWLAEGSMYYLTGKAVGLESLTIPQNLITLAVINVMIMIPSSPGFVGVFEASGIWILGIFTVGEHFAKSYVVLVHAAQFIPITIAGLLFMWKYNLSFRKMEQVSEEMPEDLDSNGERGQKIRTT